MLKSLAGGFIHGVGVEGGGGGKVEGPIQNERGIPLHFRG